MNPDAYDLFMEKKLRVIRSELLSAPRALVPIVSFRALYRVIEYFSFHQSGYRGESHKLSLATLRGYIAARQFVRNPNQYYAKRCHEAARYMRESRPELAMGVACLVADCCQELCELNASYFQENRVDLAMSVIRSASSVYQETHVEGVDDFDALRGVMGVYSGRFLDTVYKRDLSPLGKKMKSPFDLPNRVDAENSHVSSEKVPKRSEVVGSTLEPLFDVIFGLSDFSIVLDETSIYERLAEIEDHEWNLGTLDVLKAALSGKAKEPLLYRIRELEETLEIAKSHTQAIAIQEMGIGHNNPPLDMKIEPEIDLDIVPIGAALNELKAEIEKEDPDPTKLKNTTDTIVSIQRSWGQFFASKLEVSTDEFFKEFGKWGGRLAILGLTTGAFWLLDALGKLEPLLEALRQYTAMIKG